MQETLYYPIEILLYGYAIEEECPAGEAYTPAQYAKKLQQFYAKWHQSHQQDHSRQLFLLDLGYMCYVHLPAAKRPKYQQMLQKYWAIIDQKPLSKKKKKPKIWLPTIGDDKIIHIEQDLW